MLLEAFSDYILADSVLYELIPVLEGVQKLAGRNQLKFACSDEHECQHDRQYDEHIQRVLRDVPRTDREYRMGTEFS